MSTRKIIITEAFAKFLSELREIEKTKVKSVFLLFEEYGQALPTKYLKRISGTRDLWELRAKRVRIFIVISGSIGVAVHGIIKKTQKTPPYDIEVAVRRAKKAMEDIL